MRDSSVGKAAPSGSIKRLQTAAPRLVDLQAWIQRKQALLCRLVERLTPFPKREDLTECARAGGGEAP